MHATKYVSLLRIINLMKIPFVICADMDSILEKIISSDNDPTKLFASKINLRRVVIHHSNAVQLIQTKRNKSSKEARTL